MLEVIRDIGLDLFRVHPKGTGVICTDPAGIPPHVVITEYLGEIYSPYRYFSFYENSIVFVIIVMIDGVRE